MTRPRENWVAWVSYGTLTRPRENWVWCVHVLWDRHCGTGNDQTGHVTKTVTGATTGNVTGTMTEKTTGDS